MPRFRRNIWLMLAQNTAVFFGIAVQGLILNLYLVGLGYREDFVGLVAFAQTAAIGGGALPASSLSSRFGPRRCLMAATIGLAASYAGMALIEESVPLILASVASGLSMALIFVPSAPYLMENAEPEQRRAAFSANFAALSFGSIVGSAFGGILPGLVGGGDIVGFRTALVAGAGLTALGILPMFGADDTRAAAPAIPTEPAPVSAGRRPPSIVHDLIAMAVSVALLAAATGLIIQFFNVYLRDVVGAPTATIGTVFAIASLMMAPASLFAPAVARRWGAVPVINLTRLTNVPLLLALAIAPPSMLLSSSIYILRAGTVSISQPLDNAFAMELVPPRQRARIAGLRTLAWNGGWAIATGIGGYVIVWVGYPTIFFAAAVLIVGSVAVHWLSFRGR